MLDQSSLERAVMSRLLEQDFGTDKIWPVQYLIGCHRRSIQAHQMFENDGSIGEVERGLIMEALQLGRQLSVSYVGFILHMHMFPQPDAAEARGAGQIVDSYLNTVGDPYGGGAGSLIPEVVRSGTRVESIHPDFLSDYIARFAEDGVEEVMNQIGKALIECMSSISILGDFGSALTVLSNILSNSIVSAHLCASASFLPAIIDDNIIGRSIENETILGAAFGISAIPDIMENPMVTSTGRTPDVAEKCFPGGDAGRQADIRTSCTTIQVSLDQLQVSLHRIIMGLLKNGQTKERVLSWFSAVLRVNRERTKMRPDMKKASTDGFMLNICSVLLRLCRPFLDPTNGKAWGKLDVKYISDPNSKGCAFDDDTRLGLPNEELVGWTKECILNEERSYHFICECFFLTGNALRLGVFKALENCQQLVRAAKEYDREAQMAPNDAFNAVRINSMRKVASRLKSMAMCFEATMQQKELLDDFIAYYGLLASYLPRLAFQQDGGEFLLPLPSPAPKEFLSLPVR
jgi:ubiquitin conjugation factor E4 B